MWIKALLHIKTTCSLVAYLNSKLVNLIMDKAGLTNLIPLYQQVSASNGYGRDFYQLGDSLHMNQQPDMCVVFYCNTVALMAVRENKMRSIGTAFIYPSQKFAFCLESATRKILCSKKCVRNPSIQVALCLLHTQKMNNPTRIMLRTVIMRLILYSGLTMQCTMLMEPITRYNPN